MVNLDDDIFSQWVWIVKHLKKKSFIVIQKSLKEVWERKRFYGFFKGYKRQGKNIIQIIRELSEGKQAYFLQGDKTFDRKFYNSLSDTGSTIFATNVRGQYPNVISVPIGIPGNDYEERVKLMVDLNKQSKKSINLVYMNFKLRDHIGRRRVFNFYKKKSWVTAGVYGTSGLRNYLYNLRHHKFSFSPIGEGIDCYRTWESILLGTIPIVVWDPIYKNFPKLPILFIKGWWKEILTPEYLNESYDRIMSKEYDLSFLRMSYWNEQIAKYNNL